MQSTHTLFSEIQKQYTFSPIKTFRLFDRLRRENKLVEQQDWYKNDGKLFVDATRFFAELEGLGYTNSVVSNGFKSFHLVSNENENEQNEITAREKIRETSEQVKSDGNDLPKNEIERNHLKPDEIKIAEAEQAAPSPEQGNVLAQVVSVKDELIDTLKKDVDHFRSANEDLIAQNRELTHMTRLLVAPKEPEVKNVPVQAAGTGEPIMVPPDRNWTDERESVAQDSLSSAQDT